jgi:alkanesulfonate monooxygenase SsuD/methylene tetrahydromethanopterin reductase-like flavin-dependent oxidoreductase (luciferase family)
MAPSQPLRDSRLLIVHRGRSEMRYGMILPGGNATEQVEQAVLAEELGWDGIFVWEAAYGVDAWSLLSAIAVQTKRITIGTLLTPLPWRRPWKVASQVATVDQLSGGRVVLTVGIGAIMDDLPLTGEETGVKERAGRLDEGIDLMRTLWDGGTSYHGRFYDYEAGPLDELSAMGAPVRRRIPVWVVAVWPRPRSMNRALRCEGVVPQYEGLDDGETPGHARAVREWLDARGGAEIELVAQGETPPDDPKAATALVSGWAGAGCTWWLETRWETPHGVPERMRQVRDRLAAGPPRAA